MGRHIHRRSLRAAAAPLGACLLALAASAQAREAEREAPIAPAPPAPVPAPLPTAPAMSAEADTPAPEVRAAAAAPAERIEVRAVWSQFADLPLAGDADAVLRHGGKVDAHVAIAGDAFGAEGGWTLNLHPELRYGRSANGTLGLIPSNTALYYPDSEGAAFDLPIDVTRRWDSGASLTVGKINVLDLAADLPIVGGGGHEGFQNLALALPPSAIVPGSLTGAMLSVPTDKALLRLWVFDPELQSQRSGLESPFADGVGFLGSVTVPARLGGRRGYYAVKLAGSTRDSIADDALPAVLVPPPGAPYGGRLGEISAVIAAYQYVAEYPEHPGAGIGLFGQVYLSNGDPTFLDRSGFIGIAGNPRTRPRDRFGLTYFRYSLTDRLVSALAGRVALEDEEGVEAFYTFALADRLRLTIDLQAVDPAISARDLGVIGSLRLTTSF